MGMATDFSNRGPFYQEVDEKVFYELVDPPSGMKDRQAVRTKGPYLVDDLWTARAEIDGQWWIARPEKGPFIHRIRDALWVLLGKADAVRFYKQ